MHSLTGLRQRFDQLPPALFYPCAPRRFQRNSFALAQAFFSLSWHVDVWKFCRAAKCRPAKNRADDAPRPLNTAKPLASPSRPLDHLNIQTQRLLRPAVPSDPRDNKFKISSLRRSNLCGEKSGPLKASFAPLSRPTHPGFRVFSVFRGSSTPVNVCIKPSVPSPRPQQSDKQPSTTVNHRQLPLCLCLLAPLRQKRTSQSLLHPTVPSDPRDNRFKISSLRSSNLSGVKIRFPLLRLHPCRSCHPWLKISAPSASLPLCGKNARPKASFNPLSPPTPETTDSKSHLCGLPISAV